LRKLCDHQVINLTYIRSKYPQAKESRWYNENEFYHYHHQNGHDTNKFRTLQHKIQDLIDHGKLEVANPMAIPN